MSGGKEIIMYESHVYVYGRMGKLRIVCYNLSGDEVKRLKAWFKALIPKAKATYSKAKKRLEIKYVGTREEIDAVIAITAKILYDIIYRGLGQPVQGTMGVEVVVEPKPRGDMNTTIPYY